MVIPIHPLSSEWHLSHWEPLPQRIPDGLQGIWDCVKISSDDESIRFSRGSVQELKSPSLEDLWGALRVCEYMISVKMNHAVHELHSPRAWASEQPLPCFWGQNIMLDRAISILVLHPRSSKTSPALTLVAKALPFREERKHSSFHRDYGSSGAERKINS